MKLLRILAVLVALLFTVVAVAQDDEEDLGQSITTEDPNFGVTLTVNYPDDWMALAEFGTVLLTNTEDVMGMLESGQGVSAVEEGQVAVSVSGVGTDIFGLLELDPDSSLSDILNALFVESVAEADFSDIEELDLDGKNAVAVAASSTVEDDPGRLYVIVTEEEEGFVVFSALTAQGDDQFDDTLQQIAGAVEATFGEVSEVTDIPAEATEEVTQAVEATEEVVVEAIELDIELTEALTTEPDPDLGAFTISYPEGWAVNAEPGTVTMANSEDLLAQLQETGESDYETGDAAVNIGVLPKEILPFLGLQEDSTPTEIVQAIIEQSVGGNPNITVDFSDPRRVSVDGNEQVVVSGNVSDEGTESYATFIVAELPEAVVLLTGLTATDDDSFLETFQSIAASVEFTAPTGEDDQ